MRRYIAIIIVLFAFSTGQARAQRCLPKMQGIKAGADTVNDFNLDGKDGGYSFGAAFSTYTKRENEQAFGGGYPLRNNPYKDIEISMVQLTAEDGYYLKILLDAQKIVFVYAGALALAGYEAINWGRKVLHDGSTLHDRDASIYSGTLTLDMECYVTDRIALLASLRERCPWSGDTRKFRMQFEAGIKSTINWCGRGKDGNRCCQEDAARGFFRVAGA